MMRGLRTAPGDELILADNSATIPPIAAPPTVVPAPGERSPAHARNAGAACTSGEWILFLDADTRPPTDLLERYFEAAVPEQVGVLAGEIQAAPPGDRSIASRYAAERNFLSARAHLSHRYRPRAAAANLMVRRVAWDAAGGFLEGIRTAEDTDLCWRLQDLGWTLDLRENAAVAHEYRTTVRELRAQWRAYAAGRAWLARRHPGFHPESAASRALRRLLGRGRGRHVAGPPSELNSPRPLERIEFLGLDVLLGIEELVGLRMENRPASARDGR
jgi:GT2 family glycosyltransferase